MTLCPRLKNQVGFTLIEMAVVIVIVGIIISIAAGIEDVDVHVGNLPSRTFVVSDPVKHATNFLNHDFSPLFFIMSYLDTISHSGYRKKIRIP